MDSSLMLQKSFTLARFQFYFRVITFCINLYVVRFLEREIIGIVNIRLMLLYTTIVFIAREPFRKVCLGLSKTKSIDKVFNLVWLIIPLSIIIAGFFSVIWREIFDISGHSEYKTVVIIFGLAAVIELSSEPMWVYGQMNLHVTLRVLIEASSLLIRTILSTILYFNWPMLGLYAFAIAQIVYAVIITSTYFLYFYWYFSRGDHRSNLLCESVTEYRQIFPNLSRCDVEPEQFKMVVGFVLNCVLKQILTEGERYLMTISDWVSLEMQGEFDVISNLGSLAPRLVFSSIEDSCHLAFSKMLIHGRSGHQQEKVNLTQSYTMLSVTLRIVTILGLTILVFAQAYSWPLLALYAGTEMATNGASLLRVFALYVLLLACNGVTECFYYSVVSQDELRMHTYRMMAFSAVFVVSGGIFVSVLGTVGVIWANCVNMVLRIGVSLRFIRIFFNGTEYSLYTLLSAACPGLVVMTAYLCSLIATLGSMLFFDRSFVGQFSHIVVGAVAACVVLGTVLLTEASLLTLLREKISKVKVKRS